MSYNYYFLGLLYVIETQKVLDLKVNLMASYIIVPETGFYDGTQNILLLDLGHFKVRKEVINSVVSITKHGSYISCLIHFQITSLSKKHLPQLTVNTSNLEEIMSRAYDSFDVQLINLQFLYSKPGTLADAKTVNPTTSIKVYLLLP